MIDKPKFGVRDLRDTPAQPEEGLCAVFTSDKAKTPRVRVVVDLHLNLDQEMDKTDFNFAGGLLSTINNALQALPKQSGEGWELSQIRFESYPPINIQASLNSTLTDSIDLLVSLKKSWDSLDCEVGYFSMFKGFFLNKIDGTVKDLKDYLGQLYAITREGLQTEENFEEHAKTCGAASWVFQEFINDIKSGRVIFTYKKDGVEA